jgi:hypothetical protein
MRPLTKRMRLLSIGAAAGLTLGLVGTAAAVTISHSPAAPYRACSNAKSVLSVEVHGKCPAGTVLVIVGAKGAPGAIGDNGINGARGPKGATGARGKTGPKGAAGANGTNGASVRITAGVPIGSCTTGDSDVDLATGEVYTCTTGAWVNSSYSIMGPAGAKGAMGATGPAGPAMWISGGINTYSLDYSTETPVNLLAADIITNRIAVVGPITDVADPACALGYIQCGILYTPSATSIETLMSSPAIDQTFTFSIENLNGTPAQFYGGAGVKVGDSSNDGTWILGFTTTTFVCQVTSVTTPAITCY